MSDNIGQAAAEVHDFICFVTFVNLIHPQKCILTSESIKDAEALAPKIPFPVARQEFAEPRQAYRLQTPVPGYPLRKARELPAINRCIMEQWHKDYLSHAAATGTVSKKIPFLDQRPYRWVSKKREHLYQGVLKNPSKSGLVGRNYVCLTRIMQLNSPLTLFLVKEESLSDSWGGGRSIYRPLSG